MGSSITLTNRTLLKLNDALNSLDGSKAGKDEVIPFEFAPAVSWKLSKNSVIVERAKLAFDKALRQQAKQLGIQPGESVRLGKDEVPDAHKTAQMEKFAKFNEATEELKDQETELSGILCITLDELLNKPANADGKVLKNPIPQSVRNGLVPIITEEGAK